MQATIEERVPVTLPLPSHGTEAESTTAGTVIDSDLKGWIDFLHQIWTGRFASNLGIARKMFQVHPELVTAAEFPGQVLPQDWLEMFQAENECDDHPEDVDLDDAILRPDYQVILRSRAERGLLRERKRKEAESAKKDLERQQREMADREAAARRTSKRRLQRKAHDRGELTEAEVAMLNLTSALIAMYRTGLLALLKKHQQITYEGRKVNVEALRALLAVTSVVPSTRKPRNTGK